MVKETLDTFTQVQLLKVLTMTDRPNGQWCIIFDIYDSALKHRRVGDVEEKVLINHRAR
jgi:hypothetical protein